MIYSYLDRLSNISKWLVSLMDSIFKLYRAKILYELSTYTIIHIHIEKMTVVSPLNNIYYYSSYDTRMTLTQFSDMIIHTQIKWMIVVLVLNNIYISG